MKISKVKFGEYQSKDIDLYTIENEQGLQVKVMEYGATITSIKLPNGKEIACGFDTFENYFSEAYKGNAPYFGSTVGRYCSQIKDAKFSIDGQMYNISKNAGENNLHGGVVGFDKKVWKAEQLENALKFSLLSPDGDEGFPGNVNASVTIELTDDNEIKLSYEADTDKATPLSMTNHTYFNLSGFKTTVEPFVAKVNTNKMMAMDETGAATGEILDVTGTSNDFQNEKTIEEANTPAGGLENFYIFDNAFELAERAVIADKESGCQLQVFSTEPCMLLYTGKYTSDDLKREDGLQYGKYRGFCCETHRWQNGPNIPMSPRSVTQPGEKFTSQTIFKLSF